MLQFTLADNSLLQLPAGSNLLTITKLSLINKSPIVEGILDGMPIDLQASLKHGGRVEFLEMDKKEFLPPFTKDNLKLDAVSSCQNNIEDLPYNAIKVQIFDQIFFLTTKSENFIRLVVTLDEKYLNGLKYAEFETKEKEKRIQNSKNSSMNNL